MSEHEEELQETSLVTWLSENSLPPRVQEVFCFGKIRAFNTFTALEWLYLSMSLVALTVSLGITIERLTREDPNDSDFTFSIVLLVTILFCYHYVVHSVFTECWDELMVFVVSNAIVLIYCVVNYFNNDDGSSPSIMKLIRLVVICSISPFLIVFGVIQSYKYFISNNLVYSIVGCMTELQSACRMFLICVSLLKFHLQLQINMLILIMIKGVTELNLKEKVILGSGVPVTVLFVIVGYLGMRYENFSLITLFYVLGVLENTYVTYKVIDTAQHDFDDVIRDSTFACGAFALLISGLLFASYLHYTRYYFGIGLKERMFGNGTLTPPRTSTSVQYDTFTDPDG